MSSSKISSEVNDIKQDLVHLCYPYIRKDHELEIWKSLYENSPILTAAATALFIFYVVLKRRLSIEKQLDRENTNE